MKKLKIFLDTAALGKVFMVIWGIAFLFLSSLFLIFSSLLGDIPIWRVGTAGVAGGFLLSIIITNMVSTDRKSDLFWKKAKQVRKLVDDAETSAELLSIFNENYIALKNLAIARSHWNERDTIHSILTAKVKAIKHVKEKMFTEDEMERFALYVETERSKEPNSGNTSISKYLADFKKLTKK